MWGHYVHSCAQLTHYLQKHQYVPVISSAFWLANDSLQGALNIALIVKCFIRGGKEKIKAFIDYFSEMHFELPSCVCEPVNSDRWMMCLWYSVWVLISTSKPQREDSIHLSLSLPPPLPWRRGIWQYGIETKNLQEKLFKATAQPSEVLINPVFLF